MNETYTAYLDRIVDGEDAVLLLEEDGETVDQFVVDVEALPTEGQYERAFFTVEVADGALLSARHRPDIEQRRRERIEKKSVRTKTPIDELDPEDL